MTTKNGFALAAAFIGGAVVGAAAGLLFAPEKGEEQRRKIKEALEKSGVKLDKEEFNKLVDRVKSAVTPSKKEEVPSEDFDVE
ncbi:MAG: YtxH domain-containing protein [Bacteroidaceae bacterium]|jgi:gas vesicle protein|nr:YtxH domain-containing protein [Bacteroidaceae bacterium]